MELSDGLSGALLVTTVVYAWLTWRIVGESRKAAEASRESADAARLAAEAAQASAWVAEAQLPVHFKVVIDRLAKGPVWLSLEPAVSLWLHSARLEATVMANEDPHSASFYTALLEVPYPESHAYPIFLHRGESASLSWPEPAYRLTDYGVFGFVTFNYSLAENSPVRTRRAYFESIDGLGDWMLKKSGIKEGVLNEAAE